MKKLILFILVCASSCSPYRYYIKPGVMEFNSGKYNFTPTGTANLLSDTTIHGYLIIRK